MAAPATVNVVSRVHVSLLLLEWLLLNLPLFLVFLFATHVFVLAAGLPAVAVGFLVAFAMQVVAADIMYRTARGQAPARRDWRWIVAWLGAAASLVCLVLVLTVGHSLGDDGVSMLIKCFPAGLILIPPLLHCEWLASTQRRTSKVGRPLSGSA